MMTGKFIIYLIIARTSFFVVIIANKRAIGHPY